MTRRLFLAAAAAALGLSLSGCLAADIPYERLEARYAGPASRYLDQIGRAHV
jgi:hypothetical protein